MTSIGKRKTEAINAYLIKNSKGEGGGGVTNKQKNGGGGRGKRGRWGGGERGSGGTVPDTLT